MYLRNVILHRAVVLPLALSNLTYHDIVKCQDVQKLNGATGVYDPYIKSPGNHCTISLVTHIREMRHLKGCTYAVSVDPKWWNPVQWTVLKTIVKMVSQTRGDKQTTVPSSNLYDQGNQQQ